MKFLTLILSTVFIISFTLNYLCISKEKSVMKIVNEMGLGYNLAYSFDCYDFYGKITNPDEQITLMGNPIPTKKLISNIKKYGFKTIRFPVTWINFIDDYGNVNAEWMSRVKQVVKWIVKMNIYCILNLYHDGDSGNWLSSNYDSKNKYINLWTQIAEEFKDYNEYLIFESMNKPLYFSYFDYDYDALLYYTQSFVDTIRNSEGYNKKRLLIISGMNGDMQATFNKNYKMPKDSINKLAISVQYYIPFEFTSINYNLYNSYEKWGNEAEYKELIENFNKLKKFYINNGIPVIIGEIGVLTEDNKEITSIREYLYAVFSLSNEYEGIMSCLWDTSNKKKGNMNYYNREADEWYDVKIKDNFDKILKGNIIKSSDFYIITNLETTTITNEYGDYIIKVGVRKALKIILNISYIGKFLEDYYFEIYSYDQNGWMFNIEFNRRNGKKQYDGTIIFTVDISNQDINNCIEIYGWYGVFKFNNITIEYKENFISFDYQAYKSEILKEIS